MQKGRSGQLDGGGWVGHPWYLGEVQDDLGQGGWRLHARVLLTPKGLKAKDGSVLRCNQRGQGDHCP